MYTGAPRNIANWLSGGAHAAILSLAFHADSSAVWPYAMAAMSAVSFAAWMGNYRRRRHIEDTPTSRIASAAQGYVELRGQAAALEGEAAFSALTQTPCLWYAYQIKENVGRSVTEWYVTDSGCSASPFAIEDDSGRCRVDPRDAEITTQHKNSWFDGGRRCTEWLLLEGDPLYVIGDFSTAAALDTALEVDSEVGTVLAGWKRDPQALKTRFDLDRNGEIDAREWELARRAARREVEAARASAPAREGAHVVSAPQSGRPFLISNLAPEQLGGEYLLWGWLHVAIFIAAAAAAFVLFAVK